MQFKFRAFMGRKLQELGMSNERPPAGSCDAALPPSVHSNSSNLSLVLVSVADPVHFFPDPDPDPT